MPQIILYEGKIIINWSLPYKTPKTLFSKIFLKIFQKRNIVTKIIYKKIFSKTILEKIFSQKNINAKKKIRQKYLPKK